MSFCYNKAYFSHELFLSYQGGVQHNSLQHVLQTQYDIQNPLQILQGSSYYDTETFKTLVRNKGNNFRIFSSNIQSINAKFDELEAYVLELEQMQFHYSVLCLQECWIKHNDDITQIQSGNYTSIVQGALSNTRGGLPMYIHETHTYKVLDNHFKFDTWEYQTVKITGGGTNKDIIIINIYRPPNDIQQHYKTFIDEFAKLLSCFDKSNSEIIITGDLNIDLLKINQRPIFSEFYDILTANSYLPKITLPTRFTETSGTLIDNFFCKLTNITIESVAGILTKTFSDHQLYFILLNAIIEKPHMPKYIKIRVQSEYAFNNFKKGYNHQTYTIH